MSPPRPLRIAYVIDTIDTPAAGTERQLLLLLAGLDPAEFTPHVVCLRHSPWLDERTFTAPLTLYDVPSFRHPGFLRDLVRFVTLCRRERFDIVQTFFVDANIFGTVGAALSGVRVVISSRRNIGHWHNSLQIKILRGLRRWTHWYLSNSHAVADNTCTVEGVDPRRVVVIPNGLDMPSADARNPEWRSDMRRRWGIPDTATVVGSVANLREVKNLPEFVTALGRLKAEGYELHGVIVGEGPDREALEAQIREGGLEGRVHLVGRLLDVAPALAAFDIAVQCSRAESFSNSLIEAMAAGCPVVVSSIPGNLEAVGHERNGLVYPTGDPGALAGGIARLIRDPELARRLAAAAAAEASARFSLGGMLAAHADFYRRITGGQETS